MRTKKLNDLDVMALDFGSSSTIIIYDNEVIVEEPTVIAINKNTGKMVAIGREALLMEGGKDENIQIFHPFDGGLIIRDAVADQLVQGFIQMAVSRKGLIIDNLYLVVTFHSCLFESDIRALRDSCKKTGICGVQMLSEPIATVIGLGIDIDSPMGCMFVSIGEGVTETAVVSLGGIVAKDWIRFAGIDLAACFDGTIARIGKSISKVMKQLPPELIKDIESNGIWLTGGGALFPGLDQCISNKIGIKCRVADKPIYTVAEGAFAILKRCNNYAYLLNN